MTEPKSCFMGDEDPIKFPCDFPIKIMGPKKDGFAEAITDIVKKHDPGFDGSTLESRLSAKGNYISYTATIKATAREQLDGVYLDLTKSPFVRVVI